MALSNYTPRYTFEDYELWEGDWELWSGYPVSMSPSPGMAHQILSGRVYRRLSEALESAGCQNCMAVPEIDWRATDDTILRPDISVVCDHPIEAFIKTVPCLVVEVLSPSTRQRDLFYKRDLYEKLGVANYLIVDPSNSSTLLLKQQRGNFVVSDTPTATLSDDCQVSLDLSDLFEGLPE